MKIQLELAEMTTAQLHKAYDLTESLDLEDARRKIGETLDQRRHRVCEYTFAHTRHWCGHDGCRNS